MTGAQNIEIHADEPSAVKASGLSHASHQDPQRRRITLDGDLLAIMEAL
jgi:hypothetical protein